jgi:hypothetical protein
MKTLEAIERAKQRGPKAVPDAPLQKERAAELVAMAERVGRGKNLRTTTTWPGGTVAIEIEVLSSIELDEAIVAASLKVADLYGKNDGVGVQEVMQSTERHKMIQIVWRALKEPGSPDRVFKTADDLGRLATDDEIFALFMAYCAHKTSVDPEFSGLTKQEIDAIEAAIKKKDAIQLRLIASGSPRESLLTLVDLLVKSLTERSIDTP